jgi:hypothetical protein
MGPATATSIVHSNTPASKNPAAIATYCEAGDLQGGVAGNYYTPICSVSYIGEPSDFILVTVVSFQACADMCDGADRCPFFSYILDSAVDNCRYFNQDAAVSVVSVMDVNVDSGILV